MPPTEETAAVENKSVVVNVSHRHSSLLLFKAMSELDNVIETNSKVSFFFFFFFKANGGFSASDCLKLHSLPFH